MTLSALVAAVLVYMYATWKVGRARSRFGIMPPHVTGHPQFDRVFRAHQNTVEQMISFLPLLMMVALLYGDRWAALYGGLWVVGRIFFIEGYARDTAKRVPGFLLSAVASMLAALASAIGLILYFLG